MLDGGGSTFRAARCSACLVSLWPQVPSGVRCFGLALLQLCSTPRLVIEGSCWAAAELIEPSWFLVAGSATGIIAARRGVGREVLPAALALALPSAVITFYPSRQDLVA